VKQTIRTFVAVELNAAVRGRAEGLIELYRGAGADVKWVETSNLHLTMKFLGDVRSQEITRVCEALGHAAAKVEPFALDVSGAGAFPNARRPRTLWIGAGNGEEEMIALHGQLETSLGKLGFRKEHRRFHPHLTIGRVRRSGPATAELGQLVVNNAEFHAGRIDVSQVVVFSSQLGRSGPIYEALSRASLAVDETTIK